MAASNQKEMAGKSNETPFKKICKIFATGFGSGYIPKAPGTAGALLGIPVGLGINLIPDTGGSFLALIGLIVFSCICAHVTEKSLGFEDPQTVVIDEITGMAISLWLIPASFFSVVILFILFRLFDIYKPFPVKQMEDVFTGGVSIVMDDVMAGIIANVLFRVGEVVLS